MGKKGVGREKSECTAACEAKLQKLDRQTKPTDHCRVDNPATSRWLHPPDSGLPNRLCLILVSQLLLTWNPSKELLDQVETQWRKGRLARRPASLKNSAVPMPKAETSRVGKGNTGKLDTVWFNACGFSFQRLNSPLSLLEDTAFSGSHRTKEETALSLHRIRHLAGIHLTYIKIFYLCIYFIYIYICQVNFIYIIFATKLL